MDENLIEHAAGDLKLIKEVLNRTSVSIAGFKNMFLQWGILFTVIGVLSIIPVIVTMPFNVNYTELLPSILSKSDSLYLVTASNATFWYLLSILPKIAAGTGIFIIFRIGLQKNAIYGLSKNVLKIWVFILLLNLLGSLLNSPYFSIIMNDSFLPYKTSDTFSVIAVSFSSGLSLGMTFSIKFFFFSYAIGLVCTSFFTNYKLPLYMGIAYIVLGLFYNALLFFPQMYIPFYIILNLLWGAPFILFGLDLRKNNTELEHTFEY